MNTIKAIVTDLDGTLLTSSKNISMYTKDVLSKVKEQGIEFCIATGRTPESIEYMLPQWGLQEHVRFLLAMNGSVLYDLKENYRQGSYSMKGSDLIQVVEHFEDLPVIFQVLYGPGRYSTEINKYWMQRSHQFGESLIFVDMKEFLKNRSADKFIMIFDPDLMPVVLERVNHLNIPSLAGFRSGSDCYEFTDIHINKGYGIQRLSDYLHIDTNNMAIFGDAGNDVDMLKLAGMSIAMKNGGDDAKKVADFITEKTNNEDGVAHFIEDHILHSVSSK